MYEVKKKNCLTKNALLLYLLLINFLRSQSSLNTLPSFQEGLSLCHFVGVMHHYTGNVCARQQ